MGFLHLHFSSRQSVASPPVFVSTEDEDFSILLKALEGKTPEGVFSVSEAPDVLQVSDLTLLSTEYEGFVKGGASLPPVVCVITGESLLPPL